MSTVQEAASLFGSGVDEDSDPFGSVVNSSLNPVQDSTPFFPPRPTSPNNTNHTLTQGQVTTPNAHDCQPADDLFGGAPVDDAGDLFGMEGVSDSEWLGTGNTDVNANTGNAQGEYSGYSDHTGAGSLGDENQSQGWSGYEQVQQQHDQAYGISECFLCHS